MVAAALFAFASLPALASIPGPDGTIDGCYLSATGHVRVVDSANPTCLSGLETAISWAQSSGGGVPSDLECTGCVDPTDLADNAVTSAKVADGTLAPADLAFDAALQSELDAHRTSADHDGRYFTEAELQSAGVINSTGNPVDWTKLKGVPAGFADGIDNTGGTADNVVCTGCIGTSDIAGSAITSALIADGAIGVADLAFDPATQAELDALGTNLGTAGTINNASNPVQWTKLKGVPAGFADGVDADTTYAAGSGLLLSGNTFSADTGVLQSRVSGSCVSGQAIRVVSSTGTVTCQNATYAAGSGLLLSGNTFSADTGVLQNRVSGTCASGSAIRAVDSTGTVTCQNATYSAGSGLTLTGTSFSLEADGVGMRELNTISNMVSLPNPTLASGTNYVYPSTSATFTAPASGFCIVTADVPLNTGASGSTSTPAPGLRVAYKINGTTDSVDPGIWTSVYSPTPNGYAGGGSRTARIPVTAGNTYLFGVRLASVSSDWVGDSVFPAVTYVCI